MLEDALTDLGYAARVLRKSPGFTLAAVVSLALGVGLNTSIFGIVNAVLLRPLPIESPGRVVEVYTSGEDAVPYSSTSYLDYVDLRDRNGVFSGLAAHSVMFATLSDRGRSQLVLGEIVSGNYFDVLGVRPVLGRGFVADEDARPGERPVVVLGNGFWKRQFAGSPGVLGRTVRLRGLEFTIVGVAPESFNGMVPGISPDLWVPTMMSAEVEPVGMNDVVASPTGTTRLEKRGNRWLFLTGRLKPGVTAPQAQANLATLMARLAADYPQTDKGRKISVMPAGSVRIHPYIDSVLVPVSVVLMIVVGLVLMVACANIASMLLARATARQQEMAVRLALGAGRARIVRQLLAESLLLSTLGGAAGLALAWWSTALLLAFKPPIPIALSLDLHVDVRVFLFALAVSAVTGVVFGLAPALQASRPDLVPALKRETVRVGRARRMALRDLLVVAQVAASLALLVGAGLLLRSVSAARAAELGFQPDRFAVASIDLAMNRYSDERAHAFFERLLEHVRALPGVQAATLADRLPFSINISTQQVFVGGRHVRPDQPGDSTDYTAVDPGYFATLGVPIVDGRDFGPSDRPGSPKVAIISQAMARRYWPGQRAVGKSFHLRGITGPSYEVVGVSRDYKVRTAGEEPRPYVHLARRQDESTYASMLVRTGGSSQALVQAIRREVLALDPQVVLVEGTTLGDQVGVTLFPMRAGVGVFGAFGLLAVVLAAVGLYGLIAYAVARNTREIGIRMALGAGPAAVVGAVVGQGMRLVAAGVAAGLLFAAAGARMISGVLFGVNALDAVSYAGAAALVIGVGLAANLIPARRASRVDPITALRQT